MKKVVYLATVATLGLSVGCGDDDSGSLDGSVDGSMDAGIACPTNELLLTLSDFSTAQVATLDLDSGDVDVAVDELADQDTLPARLDCLPLLMERANGLLQFQDPADPTASLGSADLNPPGGSGVYAVNPQQIVSVGVRKAYVIAQAINQVLIIDPTALPANAVTGAIDLSVFVDPDDTDGLVDQTGAIRIGDRVFVGLGRFWFDSTFAIQFEGSQLAVIDTTTDSLVDVDAATSGIQAIDLTFENPWRGMFHDATRNRLLVAATGASFGVLDGGLEAVDLFSLQSLGGVLEETDLGSEIFALAPAFQNRLAIVVGTELRAFDLAALPPASGPATSILWASDVVGVASSGDGVVTWGATGVRLLSGFGQDITPGGVPILVGTLPIYGVTVFP